MSDHTTICNDISRLFSEKLNLDVPSFGTDLVEEGVLDSLTFVDFLTHLEQEFGVRVSMEDLELDNFRSITKIAEFVLQTDRLNGKARV